MKTNVVVVVAMLLACITSHVSAATQAQASTALSNALDAIAACAGKGAVAHVQLNIVNARITTIESRIGYVSNETERAYFEASWKR